MSHDTKPPTAGKAVPAAQQSLSHVKELTFDDLQQQIKTLQAQNKRLRAQISTCRAEEVEKNGASPDAPISNDDVMARVKKMYGNPIRAFDLARDSLAEMAAWRKLYLERCKHVRLTLELERRRQLKRPSILQKWRTKGLQLLEQRLHF